MCVETAAVVVTNGIPLGSASGLPGMDSASHQRARLDARLTAHTPMSIARRIAYGEYLARSLCTSTADSQATALALLYTVAPGAIGAAHTRTSAYIRWGMSFPVPTMTDSATDSVDEFPVARTRRHLRKTLCAARHLLQEHFTVEPVRDDPLEALFQQSPRAPLAELAYTSWPATTGWLAPTHLQSVIDLLVAQPAEAALQITLERIRDPEPSGAARMRLGIVALGAAVHAGALRLLARELRGRGALVASSGTAPDNAPRLRALRARTSVRHSRIWQNLSGLAAEPWATMAHMGDIALTSAEAGMLLPLPFALFAESEQ